ncbi:hypothetical protein Baya_4550 [Bagarius yarrelli]|uniref:Uncharacterized protein n=1 Tax=Bagarius yarrelli TaxID=175774 RepID=A0A556TR23_BAGYA|nr:hypothetical protein Baya_4550 [Bagarius yarrelli]
MIPALRPAARSCTSTVASAPLASPMSSRDPTWSGNSAPSIPHGHACERRFWDGRKSRDSFPLAGPHANHEKGCTGIEVKSADLPTAFNSSGWSPIAPVKISDESRSYSCEDEDRVQINWQQDAATGRVFPCLDNASISMPTPDVAVRSPLPCSVLSCMLIWWISGGVSLCSDMSKHGRSCRGRLG